MSARVSAASGPRSSPVLDTRRIAAAGLRVADRGGVTGFTMRAVAEELGVTAMALYHYVPDKAGLVALMVDAAIVERPLPPPTGVWRDDLWNIAAWMRQTSLDHPALGKLRQSYRVWGPSILRVTERWLAVWQQSGLPLTEAVTAAATSSLAITGLVQEEAAYDQTDWPTAEGDLALLPNARLVFTQQRDRFADFELLVRALIDGLHARLLASRQALP